MPWAKEQVTSRSVSDNKAVLQEALLTPYKNCHNQDRYRNIYIERGYGWSTFLPHFPWDSQDMFCPSFPDTFSLFYFLIINISGSCSLGATEKFHWVNQCQPTQLLELLNLIPLCNQHWAGSFLGQEVVTDTSKEPWLQSSSPRDQLSSLMQELEGRNLYHLYSRCLL